MNINQIIEYKNHYNKHNKKLNFINPEKLLCLIKDIPYKEVSDELIFKYLHSRNFTNTETNWFTFLRENKIKLKSEKANEYHAQRIASLINLLQANTKIDEIHIYSNKSGTEVHIDNGNHRFRAYLYLKKIIPVNIFFSYS